MRLPACVLCLLWVMVSVASAGTTSVGLGATVTQVDPAKQRATIDRGTKAGLRAGDTGGIYAMRGQGKQKTISLEERVARGKIVEVKDTSAVIALDAVVDTVEVGAYFSSSIDAPDELAKTPLFTVVARGIGLRAIDDATLFITVEQMLADPSATLRDKALDAMIAEMKANREIIESVGRIDGGKYHGKQAGTVVDELTRADLLGFFTFVEAYPGKYLNQRWKVAELFFTWVMSGAPSGEPELKLRALEPAITAARKATESGLLDDARTKWQAILREVPDYADAQSAVDRINRVQLWMRELVADPEDTSTRSRLANQLFDMNAYSLALAQLDVLAKAKYQPYETEHLRARILSFQRKWKEADAAWRRLGKQRPDDKGVLHWLAFVKARARIDRAPDEAAGYVELGDVFYEERDWTGALKEYRKALERKGITQAQRDSITRAQRKVAIEVELKNHHDWGRKAIGDHDLQRGREELELCLKLVDKLGEPARAGHLLTSFSGAAGLANERELELELLNRRAQLVKDDDAILALGRALLREDRFDEAVAAANKASKPYLYVLASVAHRRGDLVELEKIAKQATARKLTWQMLYLARLEADRGDWQEAIDIARKHVELDDAWDTEAKRTLNAALRGLQAHEALQVNPTSARERLRMIRALAELGLVKAATAEIVKLPADGAWRGDGWWAIVESFDDISLAARLTAARNGKPTTMARKRALALFEAKARFRDKPADEANRITLAKLYSETGDHHMALATLGPLMMPPVKPAVANFVRDARQATQMTYRLSTVSDAVEREDYVNAMRLATEYQTLADRTGDMMARLSAREARLNILAAQGRYAEAIVIAEEGKALAVADGDPWIISIGDGHIARLKAAIGTNDAFRASQTRSLQICDDRDQDLCLYLAHLELGDLDSDDGRIADAIEHARKAWSLADRMSDRDQARAARMQLARFNYAAGRFVDSETLYLKLLGESRKARDIDDEQTVLLMLGAISASLGKGNAARARFQEVYDLGTRTGNKSWRALARRLEGNSWLHADHDPTKAAAALEQAAQLFEGPTDVWTLRARASALRGLANARLQQRKLPEARRTAEQALALSQPLARRSVLASTHTLLAEIAVAEGKPEVALAAAKTALDLAKQTDDDGHLASSWHVFAQAQAMSKQDAEAYDAYEKALEHVGKSLLAVGGQSERDAVMNAGDTRAIYKHAVEHYLKLGKSARAMEVLELSRDAQLKSSFDAAAVQTKDIKVRAKLDKYDAARARVQGLEKQLDQAQNQPAAQRSDAKVKALGQQIAKTRAELKEVALDLKVTHRHLYRALALDPDTLMDRRGSLPKGSVIVEYFVADDALYVFVIAAALSQPAVVKVSVSSAELAKTVAEYRAAVIQEAEKVKARDKVEQLGRKLDDWLLEPLRPHLDGATTVILLPFGPLYYVPFDALVVSDENKPVRYAIEDFRISVQTASTLEYLMKAPRPRGTGAMLAVSNPDGSLPGAQREVSRITKDMPDARVLGRKDGTIKKFTELVGNYRYIHLATHGLLDMDPRKSYLKMSDGQLTVRDIAKLQGLDQANEMVVLSACESATEQGEAAGDELISLAVSFAMAGAPALVASLWEVDDESTAELMATFYRALAQSGGDRLDALRNAKLNLLRTQRGKVTPYAAPWHWSSFQLYGDFR